MLVSGKNVDSFTDLAGYLPSGEHVLAQWALAPGNWLRTPLTKPCPTSLFLFQSLFKDAMIQCNAISVSQDIGYKTIIQENTCQIVSDDGRHFRAQRDLGLKPLITDRAELHAI